MVDQERLNYLSDKFSKMDEEIIIEVNKDGIDVAYIDVWGDHNRQIIDLYYLGTEVSETIEERLEKDPEVKFYKLEKGDEI